MVIVMPTRSHLRDEFAMVDDVFALSPISARPAQPGEADYEAIRDAFMETSRGRWFLGEYAKRNRNADTSMVLDAVARIEQALAAQQRLQQQQEMQAAQQAEASVLPEVLAAIRHAVAGAEGAAATALDSLAIELNLTPVRKGIRIIKEISWRWREIGADSRICDLIDSQVAAIEAACDQLAGTDPRPALVAAFDVIKAQLDGFDQPASPARAPDIDAPVATSSPEPGETSADVGAEIAAASMPIETPAPVAAPAIEAAASAVESAIAAVLAESVAEIAATRALHAREAAAETSVRAPEPVQPAAPVRAEDEARTVPAPTLSEPIGERAEVADDLAALNAADDDLDIVVVTNAEADAHDEAVLDLVAAEMAALDSGDDAEFGPSSSLQYGIEEPAPVDDDVVATFAEPVSPEPEPEPAPAAARPASVATIAPSAAAPSVVSPPPAPVPPSPAPAPRLAVAPMPEPAPMPPAQPVLHEPVRPAPVAQEQPRPAAALHPLPRPLPQPSLGSTLLASGLLQRPVAANDPLTPIRRMTQPEKIAFFS